MTGPESSRIDQERPGGRDGRQGLHPDLQNGGLVIGYNDKVTVPDDVKAAADAAIAGINDGTIVP